ncbi:MAG: peptide chain release factor N(5)-glutamine methyltransferase [Anaerolineae bacterium]|nr:peptide chain release factor N(5)-glutamine methyltransferase [Anaerolineae bacterium]
MANYNGTTTNKSAINGRSNGHAVPVIQYSWQLEQGSTVGVALHAATRRLKGRGIDTPKLDSELMLGYILGWTRAQLYTHTDRPLSDQERRAFEHLVERRLGYEPVAYLVGQKSFYGLELFVDHRVLIPRPETELLVDLALDVIMQADQIAARAANGNGGDPARSGLPVSVADVGTGSGAVSLAIAANTHAATVCGIDISPEALAVAHANAQRHQLHDRVQYLHGDLLEPLASSVDVIVANLPYIARHEWNSLAPDIAQFEPSLALVGGADGLDVIRRLVSQAPARLRPGGMLLMEIGASQGAAVASLAREQFPNAFVEVVTDYAYHDRIVRVQT